MPTTHTIKLGQRLQQLAAMVGPGYAHIWDCCCDHGYLGIALMERAAAPAIHFVDRVPLLMQQLQTNLAERNIPAASSWQLHCLDLSKLSLAPYSGRHLLIVAGVGGELMADLVREIYQHNPAADMDFLLCPVHHSYTLRQTLIHCNFQLIDEILIRENRRCYELLLVSTRHQYNTAITPVGAKIWQHTTPEQSAIANHYLQACIAHYQRIQTNQTLNVQAILTAYATVQRQLNLFQELP